MAEERGREVMSRRSQESLNGRVPWGSNCAAGVERDSAATRPRHLGFLSPASPAPPLAAASTAHPLIIYHSRGPPGRLSALPSSAITCHLLVRMGSHCCKARNRLHLIDRRSLRSQCGGSSGAAPTGCPLEGRLRRRHGTAFQSRRPAPDSALGWRCASFLSLCRPFLKHATFKCALCNVSIPFSTTSSLRSARFSTSPSPDCAACLTPKYADASGTDTS